MLAVINRHVFMKLYRRGVHTDSDNSSINAVLLASRSRREKKSGITDICADFTVDSIDAFAAIRRTARNLSHDCTS